MVEPKSLYQIITEEEFLPLVQETCCGFFRAFNSFHYHFVEKVDISRKFYSVLIQKAETFEAFLDEHGARENKNWYSFTEFIASIRNLTIAAFYIKHMLDRYPYYKLLDSETVRNGFFKNSRETLEFLNRSIDNLLKEAIASGHSNHLTIPTERDNSDEFSLVEVPRQLPRNIEEEQVKNEEERIIDLCQKYRNTAALMLETKIQSTTDIERLKSWVPGKMDEKKARLFTNLIHSVQSDYDTYVKNTQLELEFQNLSHLRGYISMPLHLLEVTLWLCHFYERHEDEIRGGPCKRKISSLVDKIELLEKIINYAFHYGLHYARQGAKFCEELLKSFVKTVRYELPVPQPLGFHARPSTYISLIVRRYDGEAYLMVDGEKYNAKSVMSLLQAGGAIADKGYRTVFFEGDKEILDDIKILAKHNYCEEKGVPRELAYLKAVSEAS